MLASTALAEPFRATVERVEALVWQGNDVLHWAYALGALVGAWIVLRAAHALLAKRLAVVAKRTNTPLDDGVVAVVQATRWFFHGAIALLVARQFIDVPQVAVPWVNGVIIVALFVQVGLWIRTAAMGGTRYWVAQKHGGAHAATVASGVNFVLNLVIWIVVALLALSNLGVQVSAVIAGLGVGGIAAALALQSLLSDVFAGLFMYFDRPFDIGDFIVLDPQMGTVTKIGIRTTRLRSPEGDELIVPNGDLVKTRIKNFARLAERRVQFAFAIEYGHAVEQIEQAQKIAREVVEQQPQVRFDRAHFKALGADALDFEVAYFVLNANYNLYMDVQQAINLGLYRRFEEAGIQFSFNASRLAPKRAPATETPSRESGAAAGAAKGRAA